jgi:hypothetical protein
LTCAFGGSTVEAEVISDTEINCVSPPFVNNKRQLSNEVSPVEFSILVNGEPFSTNIITFEYISEYSPIVIHFIH